MSRFVEGSATARRKPPAFPTRKPLPAVTLRGDAAAEAICAVVRRIPRGWVATYGQVATMAGMPRRARLVGRVLQRLDSTTNVPWHRVVNARGEVSFSLSRNGGTFSSDACWRRKASNSTTGTAWTWSEIAGWTEFGSGLVRSPCRLFRAATGGFSGGAPSRRSRRRESPYSLSSA